MWPLSSACKSSYCCLSWWQRDISKSKGDIRKCLPKWPIPLLPSAKALHKALLEERWITQRHLQMPAHYLEFIGIAVTTSSKTPLRHCPNLTRVHPETQSWNRIGDLLLNKCIHFPVSKNHFPYYFSSVRAMRLDQALGPASGPAFWTTETQWIHSGGASSSSLPQKLLIWSCCCSLGFRSWKKAL